jgi:hypothetical protein
MADDDFTEDFEDEPLPEEFQEAPKPQPSRRQAPPLKPPVRPAPRQVQAQAPASAPVQTQPVQYVPFSLPARVGIFDNLVGKPLMEDPDKLDLILGALTEILNRVNDIQKNL